MGGRAGERAGVAFRGSGTCMERYSRAAGDAAPKSGIQKTGQALATRGQIGPTRGIEGEHGEPGRREAAAEPRQRLRLRARSGELPRQAVQARIVCDQEHGRRGVGQLAERDQQPGLRRQVEVLAQFESQAVRLRLGELGGHHLPGLARPLGARAQHQIGHQAGAPQGRGKPARRLDPLSAQRPVEVLQVDPPARLPVAQQAKRLHETNIPPGPSVREDAVEQNRECRARGVARERLNHRDTAAQRTKTERKKHLFARFAR